MSEHVKKPTDRKPKRKGTKKDPVMVTFEVEGYEGEFTAPTLDKGGVDSGDIRKLTKGDMNPIIEGPLKEYAEILDDMYPEELEAFFEAWSKASGADLPN